MSKKKKKHVGLWMSIDIISDAMLTANEKLFLAEIVALSKGCACIASNGHFSQLFNVNKPNCTRIIKSLEKKKYIRIKIEREGKRIVKRLLKAKSTYYQNDNTPTIKKATTYYQNDNTLLSKEQRENTYRKQIKNRDLFISKEDDKKEEEKEIEKKDRYSVNLDEITKMIDNDSHVFKPEEKPKGIPNPKDAKPKDDPTPDPPKRKRRHDEDENGKYIPPPQFKLPKKPKWRRPNL